MKTALVLGGGGFIGGHLIKRLVKEGVWVRAVDLKPHPYGANPHEFVRGDLSDLSLMKQALKLEGTRAFDDIYQLAADMGGAGYIFTGENDANVMQNSATINLNLLKVISQKSDPILENINTRVFYSSSACVYPEEKQLNVENNGLKEADAYPANPDSEYGWEKLFSERLFSAHARNYGLNIRIARFHNIFGPEGTWFGGREKAPAAVCRKVAQAQENGVVEIWGDGKQTRSFLFVDECIDAIQKLMSSDFKSPVNIGSEEMITINELVKLACTFENKKVSIKNVPGPQGVRGRNSDNTLIRQQLNWEYKMDLVEGLRKTYFWIKDQISIAHSTQRGNNT
jgi:nucleoside-diphosphate-sugar epimerase